MSVEAELKAHVRKPDRVRDLLRNRSTERVEIYVDTYFDRPDGTLTDDGRELRVRVIDGEDGSRAVLTYKEPAVDQSSGSKPEYESGVEDAAAVRAILDHLGYVQTIAFTKHCRNYRFMVDGRNILATLVHVPELSGTFLEVETIAEEDDVPSALDAVRSVLGELGITEDNLTTEQYTEAVKAARQGWDIVTDRSGGGGAQ